MSIWQKFIDSIFGSPFGKVSPADEAAARALGAAIEPQLLANMMASRERNRLKNGASTAYRRGQDAAARRGEYAITEHMLTCPYPEGSQDELAFHQGYFEEAQRIDVQSDDGDRRNG